MTGLVELVLSGSSFRVLIGETVVLVHLTGVQCPSNKKDEDKKEKKDHNLSTIAKEAKHFTELQLLHRDVTIVLDGIDKNEYLYGTIVLSNSKCYQEELVSKGFALVTEWNIGNSKFSTQIRKTEQEAKKK